MTGLLVWSVAPAQAATQTYTYTGGEQTFTVPAGVFSLHVVAIGGAGGKATDAVGGVGAEATGSLSVAPGQTLYVEVGGRGQSLGEGGAGGFNGGGSGSGGGGGASDVRTSPQAAGLAPDRRLIVAAGGGGGGGSGESAGSDGGAAGSPGVSGEYAGGGAGTETEGGAGSLGCESSGGNGLLGVGGDGGNSGFVSPPGGGGGGGYYGGGGGAGACFVGSSGGGGGSSLVPPGGSLALVSPATNPQIQLTYTLPPPEEKVVPNTILGFHPQKKIKTKKKKVKVKFTFSSNVTGATFKCKLDKGAFASCKSPKTYKVKPGKHKFSVEAVSAGGTDSSPATFGFSVKKKH
jgi:hypothetical protein